MKVRAKNLLNRVEQDWLVDCIQRAEKQTTGEIRVHLEDVADRDSFDRAAEVFAALNMHETFARNGVLIYVEVCQNNFVVLGDMSFNDKVDDTFWQMVSDDLSHHFKQGYFFEGLAHAVDEIGGIMKKFFPIENRDNPNELSDSISFGK